MRQQMLRGRVKLKKGPSMFKNKKLQAWVEQMQALCQPDQVVICDGSQDEYDRMWQLLLNAGAAVKLTRPNDPTATWFAQILPTLLVSKAAPIFVPTVLLMPAPTITG